MTDQVTRKSRKLVMTILIIFVLLIYIALLRKSYLSEQQWALYHSEELTGGVVDAETQQPIEGAIVVGLWQLTQIPGEGFGGYAKIQEATTDKDGTFTLPAWTTFKPWKICCETHELAPKIVIYKPGYRIMHGTNPATMRRYLSRQLRILDKEKNIKEGFNINPAKLVRANSDKDIWEQHSEFRSQANYPDTAYSKKQLKNILNTLQEGVSQLPATNDLSRRRLFKDIKEDRDFYVGGAK